MHFHSVLATAMSRLGKIEEFDAKVQTFDSYLERFEHFVSANDIAQEKKLSVFLTVIGAEAYEVLKNLVVPALPGEKTFDEVKVLLRNHYSPPISIIAERCRFNCRVQLEHESVEDFITEIKHLARKCDFGSFLKDAMRDRLVAGIRSEDIQRALFTEENLSFESACKIALARELAAKQTAILQAGGTNSGVNAVKSEVNPTAQKNRSMQRNEKRKTKCSCCGKAHDFDNCWYKNYKCNRCSQVGHLQKMCPRKALHKRTHIVSESSSEDEHTMYACHDSSGKKKGYIVTMTIEGKSVPMQVDTGAAVTVVPEEVYRSTFPHVKCEPTAVVLKTYTGEKINVLGECQVKVQYDEQQAVLPAVIVHDAERKLPVLLGRTWLEKFQLNWQSLFSLSIDDRVASLREKYAGVFSPTLGAIKNYEAQIVLKPGASPVFCRARPVPFALREAVEKQLDELEKHGVVTRVSHSDWATPLVVVPKKEGDKLRLCGDFKVTVNPVLKMDHYPLPQPEELFTSVCDGKVFCVLDLSSAYQQVVLSEESRRILTVNTHKGLYQFNRLPYGIASAPALFQALMDKVLIGIKNVGCYIDDVIIAGKDVNECYKTFDIVLKRLSEHNITLRTEKCKFFQSSVRYLGHQLSSEGRLEP